MTDRKSHRAMDKALIETDMILQAWGKWARGEIGKHAWPRESPMFKILREVRLGIRAKTTVTAGSEEVSAQIMGADRIVARLEERQKAAIWSHYIARGETRFHCARAAGMSVSEYDRALERGRWTIHTALPFVVEEKGGGGYRSENEKTKRVGGGLIRKSVSVEQA